MAARWGTGEEILSACSMELFSTETLDQELDASMDSMGDVGLDAAEALGTLQGCMDPSILSLFEDCPTGEGKCLDEECEATLLTALTEILDNVDDDNLSPFDTLPDSDLLSAQKGRELSPLRRLLCLSRSPPEKSSFCSGKQSSTGKSLPRSLPAALQRSDGEEEEDGEAISLSLSPNSQPSSPGEEQLSWAGLSLPFPIALEEEDGDGLSLSLGDLVRHMHPYCMTLCMEEGGEQLLPEGGILLEVVDQGEHGEPILAIPDQCLPISLAQVHGSSEVELSVPEEAAILDRPELDDVVVSEATVETLSPVIPRMEVRGKKVVTRRHKEVRVEKSSSQRKKKRKEEAVKEAESLGGRVLRSTSARRAEQDHPPKPAEKRSKPEKKKMVSSPAVVSSPETHQVKPQLGVNTSTLCPPSLKITTPPVFKPDRLPAATTPEKLPQPVHLPPAPLPKSHLPDALTETAASTEPLPPSSPLAPSDSLPSEDPPTTTPEAGPAPEPKPKPLSLQQYRLLRQQKRPVPLPEDHSTRWPSLPEAPKGLCPIPCLPAPQDPRRSLLPQAGKKEEVEVKSAWQPLGPCAPPTPEALLAPPAYMVAPSKASSAASTLVKHGSSPPTQTMSNSAPPSQPHPALAPSPAPSPVKAPQPTPDTPVLHSSPNIKPLSRVQTWTPANTKPLTLHNNNTQSKTETLKASAVQPAAQTHPRNGTHPQPGALAPVVSSAAPFKTTTAPPTPTAAGSAPPSTTAAILLACKPSTPPALAPRTLARPACCPQTHSTERPVKPGSPVQATPAQQAPPKAKSPTQDLIEAFTTEIGIEAVDLTSLLEQFEETQAKEEKCVPEVSGRAAAVGNSRVRPVSDRTSVERVRAENVSSTAALTPPATPPHQMWKPLAAVALLGKSRASEGSKLSSTKAIQIDARPLPSNKHRGNAPASSPAPWVDHTLACLDHDYCLPREPSSGEPMSGEPGKRWNVKQQPSITIELHRPTTTAAAAIKPPQAPPTCSPSPAVGIKPPQQCPQSQPLDDRTLPALRSSVLETPDASPTRLEVEASPMASSPRRGPSGRAPRSYTAASRSPSPRERKRGRSRRRGNNRSPSPSSSVSDSSSGSRSRSPPTKRYRPRHSKSSSSSCSSSCSSSSRSPPRSRRYSCSSSRSGSWSRSRSPARPWGRRSSRSSSSVRPGYTHTSRDNSQEVNRKKQKAIEERRVVYVGRIQATMTRKELKERFSQYGDIEECTLHFREHGDNYGFVTYYDTKNAFTAIENGSKLRKPNELPFDLCFGGRRQFCRTSYADLDSNREYEPLSVKGKLDALDFDTLLKQAQKGLKR